MVQVRVKVRLVERLQNARPRGRSGIARRALRLIPGKKGPVGLKNLGVQKCPDHPGILNPAPLPFWPDAGLLRQ